MLAFIDFLRDNLYWILFVLGVISLLIYFIKLGRLFNIAKVLLDSCEMIYFGEFVISIPDDNDFSDADLEFYIKIENDFKRNNFDLISDFYEEPSVNLFPNTKGFGRAMCDEKGWMNAVFADIVTKDINGKIISSCKTVSLSTLFSNDIILDTIPKKYDNNFFLIEQVIKKHIPDVETIEELIEIHKDRIDNYLKENPEVSVIPITTYDDLVYVTTKERELKRNAIPEKGCIISYSEVAKFAESLPNINVERLWKACVTEQKRRGYWYFDNNGNLIEQDQSQGAELIAEIDDSDNAEVVPSGETVSERVSAEVPVPKDRLTSIAEQVELAQKKKPNPWNALITLVISLVIFFNLGWFSWGLDFVGYIIVVLFIHEMGHYLAMRLFGYRNLKMFFIPLLGAAVSGYGHNVATYKKVLVSLAGPLPGIVLGLVMIWFWLAYDNEMCRKLAFLLLFLNGFNLLPFMPLDGGWVMHHTLYSRFPILEVGMRVVAACIFALLAFSSGDFFLFLLAFINFVSIKRAYIDSRFVKQMKREIADEEVEGMISQDGGLIEIPRKQLASLADFLSESRKLRAHDTIASEALGLWDRISTRPTGIFATLGIWLLTFIVGWCGLLVGGIASAGLLESVFTKNEIVEYEKDDGGTGLKMRGYCYNNKNHICQEIELTDDGKLFHGNHKKYWLGDLLWEGQWDRGLKVGEWKRYWRGEQDTLCIFEDGKLVSEKVLDEFEGWVEVEPDNMLLDGFDDPESEDAQAYANMLGEIEVFPEGPDREILNEWRSRAIAE